ncbi:ATP synthase epsilon chain, sodium ion specific [Caulifigura coniformis]|uniref:ATP synthase epsilon chain n=1 Tax=Caulifigura coniformis TaxID=2527983 RepID=A0A517S7F0_9PLAN|nr:F0F1 ATP synthase subunit epsilon [Caulifigura coniformis]QDT52050.1 ATP synthase epsilon chain, sodium ion specific [Caulifigura coniformis]
MVAPAELRLVVVTPETTLLDEVVRSIQFPLFDGQMGVLPGRAPAIGRLGAGELSFESGQGERRYFIDGGFLQIKGPVVTLLTNRAFPVEQIDAAAAQAEYDAAMQMKPTDDAGFELKQKSLERARKMLALKRV